jgi:hypothetical protein
VGLWSAFETYIEETTFGHPEEGEQGCGSEKTGRAACAPDS